MKLYDIKSLQYKFENSLKKVESEIIEDFVKSFKIIYKDNKVPEKINDFDVKITKKRISSIEDLKGIYSASGFYIILTNRPIENNKCKLKMGDLTAVYRGQASTVKKRIESHLTNDEYNKNYNERKKRYQEKYNKNFYEKYFSACMKFIERTNGINVDDDENKDYSWYVIVHNMKNSKERIRELAEIAFDKVFEKPIASRE